MTRFVIDSGVALALLAGDVAVHPGHRLVAPTLLRSQVLDALRVAVVRGELDEQVARVRLEGLNHLPMRLLGDGVMRREAWLVAGRLGLPSTYGAEYIALARLQGDALVTLDPALASLAANEVRVATLEDLAAP